MCISTFARTYGHFSNGFDAKFVVERYHWPRLAVAADVAQTTHRAAVFSADGLMDLPKRGQACSQDLGMQGAVDRFPEWDSIPGDLVSYAVTSNSNLWE